MFNQLFRGSVSGGMAFAARALFVSGSIISLLIPVAAQIALAADFDEYPTPSEYPTQYPTPYATPYATPYPTPSEYPTQYPTPDPTPSEYPTQYPTPYETPYSTPYATPAEYPTPAEYATPYATPAAYPTPAEYATPYATPASYPTPDTSSGSDNTTVIAPRGGGGPMVIWTPFVPGTVAGAATTTGDISDDEGLSCEAYLKEYLRFGRKNNPDEVKKLQLFLNSEMELDLENSGFFDVKTLAAVQAFQLKYSNEVLKPWNSAGFPNGEKTPSDWVYKTTRRQINNLHCKTLNEPMPLLP